MTIENLQHLALLKVSGADAASFLQGQLSNDVTTLSANWQLGGYCNPKGRLIALFYLWQKGEDYYALLHHSLVDAVHKRLSMYVLRSKVTVEAMADVSMLGAFSAEDAAGHLDITEQTLNEMPRGSMIASDTISCLKINQRYLIVQHDGKQTTDETNENWQAADISEGLPQIDDNTTEQFVPQMVNLDLLGGINFKKGCYTGQEIVARMHYLGKVKQRMFVCSFQDKAEKHQSGDKVYTGAEQTTTAGTVVSIDHSSQQLLVVLRLDDKDGPLFLGEQSPITINEQQPIE